MAATLDHIVPLAKGGLHVMENVACAHHACNSDKSDRM
jgi:5-methylcytosine-specific restriction endonuclease McrA